MSLRNLVLGLTLVGCCLLFASPAYGQRPGADWKLPGAPAWLAQYKFPQPQFTFVRIQYDSRFDRGGRGRWATDYPDADRGLSQQVDRLTSLEVDPAGHVLRLTEPQLKRYPFIYLSEAGALSLAEEEVRALRDYLLGGGFLMMDDFWGEEEWKNVQAELKRVFPDRKPLDLPIDHPIFHYVFDLKEKPQVPSINVFMAGRTFERFDSQTVHYRALFDDQKRMMALICHNTDLADGWERSAEHMGYFEEMCVKRAFPMGINVVVYALTRGEKRGARD